MFSKQVSIFIENREGRLGEVLNVLKVNGINIASLSLADTSDYGLLRIIVDDADFCCQVLKNSGFSAKVSDVLIVDIPHEVGALAAFAEMLSKENVNIEYMYGLSVHSGVASVVIKTTDLKRAQEVLSR